MNKIILFHPKTGLDMVNVSTSFPLALLHVASLLDQKGYDVDIIDQRVEPRWKELLIEKLSQAPICIGITAMSGNQILAGLKCAQQVKAVSPNTKIIWGGVHTSLLPEQTIKNEYVDVAVVGEGEETIVEIAEAIRNKKSFAGIKGIVYKENGRIFKNEGRDFVDLNTMPDPPYHLLDVTKYFFNLYSGKRTLSLLVSKGCVHKCGYCYNQVFNKNKCRCVKAEIVAERIKQLVDFGAQTIDLVSDNFFYDKRNVEHLCNLLIDNNIKVNLISNCRIDYIASFSMDFLKLLKKAGFTELFVGIESGSEKILKSIRKNLTMGTILEGNMKFKKVGITPVYSFMAGFPGETFEDINQTVDIMLKLLEDNPNAYLTSIKVFTPFAGTELFDICCENGFKPPLELEEWGSFDYNTAHFAWSSKKDMKRLEALTYMTYFLDTKSMLKHSGRNYLLKLLVKLYSKIVKIRCRHHFYSFCPEVIFIKFLKKKLGD